MLKNNGQLLNKIALFTKCKETLGNEGKYLVGKDKLQRAKQGICPHDHLTKSHPYLYIISFSSD